MSETPAGEHGGDYDALPEVGSLWRRKPPGREVVEVRRVWEYDDEDMSVRAHPTVGGRPIVASVAYLREHYTPVIASTETAEGSSDE